MPVTGSTLVAAQRSIRLITWSRKPDGATNLAIHQIELGPGRQIFDHDVAAEAQRIDGNTEAALEIGDAGEVDDRDEPGARIGEAIALRRREEAWFAAQLIRHEGLEEGAQPLLTCDRAGRYPRLFAIMAYDEIAAGILVAGAQARQRLIAHQHQIFDLGLMHRLGRVEAGRSVLDGEEPIAGEIASGRQIGPLQALGRQALDRVAIQRSDAHGPCPSDCEAADRAMPDAGTLQQRA
jgi:hypothetical protein